MYNLSILSNISSSASESLASVSTDLLHIRPLFAIGMHDISFLQEASASNVQRTDNTASPTVKGTAFGSQSWIACSTDSILETKKGLYDIIVHLPSERQYHDSSNSSGQWPIVKTVDGKIIRATQRDLRRFWLLRAEAQKYQSTEQENGALEGEEYYPYQGGRIQDEYNTSNDEPQDDVGVNTSLMQRQSSNYSQDKYGVHAEHNSDNEPYMTSINEIVEPVTWSALAYKSFLWWASVGEREIGLAAEEEDGDAAILEGLFSPSCDGTCNSNSTVNDGLGTARLCKSANGPSGVPCFGLIEYFNRLGTFMVATLADILEIAPASASNDDSRSSRGSSGVEGNRDNYENDIWRSNENRGPVPLENFDFEQLGLDVWSRNDKEFVKEMAMLYFGRKVEVRAMGLDFCGIRIC